MVELHRPKGALGKHCGHRRCDDLRTRVEQLHQPLGGPGCALQLAPHLGHGPRPARHYRRIEHERRQLPDRDAPLEHVVPADPENDGHRAKGDQHHQRDQPGLLPDARHAGAVRRLGVVRKAAAIGVLVRVRLHRAYLVHRLVDVDGDVGHPVLAAAGEPPHAPAEQQDRDEGRRHAEQHQQGQLPAGDEQHHGGARHHQEIAHKHGKAVADHLLQLQGVVGQARNHLAGAGGFEKRRLETENMVEHCPAQIGDDALAGAHHQIETEPGGDGQHGSDRNHGGERLVEKPCIAAAEAVVDHVLHALAERQHAAGSDHQGERRRRDARAVRHQEARETGYRFRRGTHRP